MAFLMTAAEALTEEINNIGNIDTSETMENLEKLKDVDPNKVVEYFKGKIPDFISFGMTVLLALVIYFIGSRLIKLLRRIVRRSLERSQVDTGVVQFVDALVKAIAYAVLLLTIISLFGIETTSFIAVFGSAGLAVGLALQGSLANFAGGVLILALKPFGVGDYISTGSSEGTVQQISLFATKLLTVDNRAIIIPNGDLANSTITNITKEEFRRLDLTVGIAYQADLLRAKQVLEQIYRKDACILQDRPIQVYVDSLGDSAVVLGARGWLEAANYWDTRWRILEQIKLQFDAEGIEIPFNQLDVHIENMSSQNR